MWGCQFTLFNGNIFDLQHPSFMTSQRRNCGVRRAMHELADSSFSALFWRHLRRIFIVRRSSLPPPAYLHPRGGFCKGRALKAAKMPHPSPSPTPLSKGIFARSSLCLEKCFQHLRDEGTNHPLFNGNRPAIWGLNEWLMPPSKIFTTIAFLSLNCHHKTSPN